MVLTVEAQAKYVGHLGGCLSKNLFLKDKKHRLYIVSALADTKVDLKVLSQRLGLGKGGLRMAPEEAVGTILQVPLGCVTPFALVNESAQDVSLLLDQGFKTKEHCFFHPLSNDISISLNAQGLDKFLKAIGKEPSYIDLEANPVVGKDQPPDLAGLVPSGSTVFVSENAGAGPLQSQGNILVSENNKANAAMAKSSKPSGQNVKEIRASSVNSFMDPAKFVEEIVDKISGLVDSELTEENVKRHGEQLGSVVSNSIRKRLCLELEGLAIVFKNTAYAEGFYAGTHQQRKHE